MMDVRFPRVVSTNNIELHNQFTDARFALYVMLE